MTHMPDNKTAYELAKESKLLELRTELEKAADRAARARRLHIGARATFALVALGLVTLTFAPMLYDNFGGPAHTYESAVGSHLTNAMGAPTPEYYIAELTAMKAGMQKLGLEPHEYGALLAVHKTPNNQVGVVYAQIDEYIDRAKHVIQWRNAQGHTQMNDAYQERISNLRNELGADPNGDSFDAIAERAYYIQNHQGLYLYYMNFWWLLLGTIAFIGLGIWGLVAIANYYAEARGRVNSYENRIAHYERYGYDY